MADRDTPQTKPNYRLWFTYFCVPFLLFLLISFVLVVASLHSELKEFVQFLSKIQSEWWPWKTAILLSIILPLSLILGAQAEFEANSKPSIKCLFQLLLNSFPQLNRIKIYLVSMRFDLWLCAALGIFSALVLVDQLNFESWFVAKSTEKEALLDIKSKYWLLLYSLLLLPAFGLLQLWDSAFAAINNSSLHAAFSKKKFESDTTNRIQSDKPIETLGEDLFDWDSKAKAFSNAVLHTEEDGAVFGVEAPWGTGKTSFINLCATYWLGEKAKSNKYTVVLYRFELLKYAGNTNLIEQFVHGLLDELEQHYYLPELRGAMQGYLAGLQGALELSGGPLKLTLNLRPSSVDDALKEINAQLERRLTEHARIVVVIDDLDRVAPDNVRDLLFALHKCFKLPRLRYVLCYDQYQLADKNELHREHGGDLASQTLYDFLDKFIGAKIYLHVPDDKFNNVWEHIKNKLPKITSDVVWKKLVEGVMTCAIEFVTTEKDNRPIQFKRALKKKYSSNSDTQANHLEDTESNYYPYAHILGNPRQLKLLFNQLCLCWPEGVPIRQYDFVQSDLLHLLLLQKEFPHVYRDLRAMSLSNEHVDLLIEPDDKNNSTVQLVSGKGFTIWLNEHISLFQKNMRLQKKLEVILKALFAPDSSALKNLKELTDNVASSAGIAANQSNLPRYIDLIEHSIAINKISKRNNYVLRSEWLENSKNLCDVIKDAKVEKWQDENEYGLWGLLLTGIKFYKASQQTELLIEYLKALPAFVSLDTLTPRRFAMARLLGEGLRNLLSNVEGVNLAKNLIEIAWFDDEHGMLTKTDPITALLGWQDAILVYKELQIQGLDEAFRIWLHEVFWKQFKSNYPRSYVAGQVQLSELEKAIQGKRENVADQVMPNPREWLVNQLNQLRYLSNLGPNAPLRNASHALITEFLFLDCWGDSQPSDAQLNACLDYVRYVQPFDDPTFSESEHYQNYISRLKNFVLEYEGTIKQLRQQRDDSPQDTDALTAALKKLQGHPNEI